MTVMKGPDGGIDVWHELERKRGLWKDRKQWFGKRIRGEVVLPPPTRGGCGSSSEFQEG